MYRFVSGSGRVVSVNININFINCEPHLLARTWVRKLIDNRDWQQTVALNKLSTKIITLSVLSQRLVTRLTARDSVLL